MQGFMPRAETAGIIINGRSRDTRPGRGGSLLYGKALRGTGVGSNAQKGRFQKGNKGDQK